METFQPKLTLCPTDFSEPATFARHYVRDVAAQPCPVLTVIRKKPEG